MRTRLLKLQRIEEQLADLEHDLITQAGLCGQCGSFRAASTEEAVAAGQVMAMREKVREMQGQAWAQEVR